MTENQQSKRDFLKKSAYVVPTILTLKAIPSFAGSGSGRPRRGITASAMARSTAPGNPPVNDGFGSGPGNPGKNFKKLKFGRKSRA